MSETFGNLTLKYFTNDNIKQKSKELGYLFKSTKKMLDRMSVIELERQIAYEHLQKLTVELQTKRLRYNNKETFKYFTL